MKIKHARVDKENREILGFSRTLSSCLFPFSGVFVLACVLFWGAPTIEIYVLALSTVFSVFCLSLSLISLSFLLIKWISRPALINIKFIFTPPCTCSNNVRRLWVHYPMCRWPRSKCLQFSRFKVTFEPKVQCRHGPDDLVKKKRKGKHTPLGLSGFPCSPAVFATWP